MALPFLFSKTGDSPRLALSTANVDTSEEGEILSQGAERSPEKEKLAARPRLQPPETVVLGQKKENKCM